MNHWFNLGVVNSRWILSFKPAKELIRVSLKACQKCPGNIDFFSLCSDISNLQTHLIPKVSVTSVWTEPELMLIYLAICLTVKRLSSKIIRWMASTSSSGVEVFGRPEEDSFVLFLAHLHSAAYFLYVKESHQVLT